MIPYFILAIEDLDDREFMSQLYVDFHRLMCHEARKIAKNDWTAEDIVQDTLLKLIDKVSLLRSLPERRLVNYIISATKNTAYNYFRKKSHEDFISDWRSLSLGYLQFFVAPHLHCRSIYM